MMPADRSRPLEPVAVVAERAGEDFSYRVLQCAAGRWWFHVRDLEHSLDGVPTPYDAIDETNETAAREVMALIALRRISDLDVKWGMEGRLCGVGGFEAERDEWLVLALEHNTFR